MKAVLLLAAADPSPDPTGGTLRPGLTETDVSPGLVGFLVTFAIAAACVLLFLSLTRHLRTARRNAEDLGLPVEQREGIGFRRDGDAPSAGGSAGQGGAGSGTGAEPGGGTPGTGDEPGGASGSEGSDGGRGATGA